jgi:hypothetical protein
MKMEEFLKLCYCGKKMWTKNLRAWNHVRFVTPLFVLRRIQCRIYNARLAIIDSTHRAYLNGFKAVERISVFSASNRGQVKRLIKVFIKMFWLK